MCEKFELPSPPALTGTLFPNEKLQEAVRVLDGVVDGPESIFVKKNTIYASVNSKVVKIRDEKVVSEVFLSERAKKLGFGRGNFDTEAECGRPLGIRKLSENEEKFAVVDAYLGVFVVDFSDEHNPSSIQVLDSQQPIDGLKPRFLNDLDVVSEDELIISDSSTTHDRRHFMPLILEHQPDGRLLYLKISTKTATVLLDSIYFPNGVQLTADKRSVLFAETSMARVRKVSLESKNVEVFADNLPGLPDNIRMTDRGTFWVGLAGTRATTVPSLLDRLCGYPRIRSFLISVVPSSYWKTILHKFKKPHTIIVELGENGDIVRSLHDTTGKVVGDVSQAMEDDGILYIGSVNEQFVAKLRL